jgi:hypothetical protein
MIQKYIHNLIDNLPDNIKKTSTPEKINIILSGGAFNGSYLIGALHFLKEMEQRKYVKVDKISACSIGSVCALLYHIEYSTSVPYSGSVTTRSAPSHPLNALDLMSELYEILLQHLKHSHNLNAFDSVFGKLRPLLPTNICETMTNRVYISYYNVKKGKKIIKYKYRNIDEIFETIRRSCFIPMITTGEILDKNKYMDGFTPYIFPRDTHKKCLYLDLFGSDKIKYIYSVTNEKTNFHRILSGLLDIHLFFIKQTNTQMCSYVEDWSYSHMFYNKIKTHIFEYIIYCIARIYYLVKKYLSGYMARSCVNEYVIFKIISNIILKIIKDVYVILLEKYCF